jgi:gamma-glutamyltranspeptidase/glutathione hydrolase
LRTRLCRSLQTKKTVISDGVASPDLSFQTTEVTPTPLKHSFRFHFFVVVAALQTRYYADPDFAAVPVDGLLSKAYAAARRTLIDPNHAAQTVAAGDPTPFVGTAGAGGGGGGGAGALADDEAPKRSPRAWSSLRGASREPLESKYGGDTVYLTVADSDGMMVSLIQSLYNGFGSGLVAPGTGFCLQDRGALFAVEPDHANVYAPKKRPFHTIMPGFVLKNDR